MPSPGSPLRDALPGPLVPAESASKRSGDAPTVADAGGDANTPRLHAGQNGSGAAGGPTQSEISARTEWRSRSITEGTEIALMARSGSFSPWPVKTQTTLDPSGTPSLRSPATEAEEAA